MQGGETEKMKEILLANKKLEGNANAQIAHLVFADTRANPEKTQRAIFFQRQNVDDSPLHNNQHIYIFAP